MTVIDVDSHCEVELRPEEHPLRDFLHRLPTTMEFIADAIAGDLRRHTPERSRPESAHLAAFLNDENTSASEQGFAPGRSPARFPSTTPAERLAWMDRVGIDHALMNPGAYGFAASWLGDDQATATRLCNDFSADRVDGHTDRMIPVSLVDWRDLDGAVAELTRMRARGSRAFWIRAQTYNDISPAHPDWDRVWSAATDLGMVAVLHVGNTPARFEGGWGNAAWEAPGGTGLGGFFSFANSMRHQAAEMMLASMIYGGVFGRHPNLTVITEELGVAWLPYFVSRCDGLGAHVPWPFDLRPGEMVRRNVRSTPLPGLGDIGALETTIHQIPEMLVFSSDYPHGEGNADPIALYEPTLSGLDDALRTSFLGANMADVFARMGDPLTRSPSRTA
jgi:predicted TIM-barrel fold metal-dependent hydrolase